MRLKYLFKRRMALFVSLVLSFAVACQTASAFAAQQNDGDIVEEILVSASRLGGIGADRFGGSTTIVQPQDLQIRQVQFVSDILRDVPGIAVNRTGAVGGLTLVRLRGAEGNHTLVLIDGMEAGDPFSGQFDFATLVADDAARIEVLRGQQSALYGSDAIGGVIHYITLTGAEAPGIRARIEGGSFGTGQFSARAAGVSGPIDYAVSGNVFHTDGAPSARNGTRDLGADSATASGKAIYSVTGNFDLTAVARYNRSKAETNPQDYTCPGPCGIAVDGSDHYDTVSQFGLLRGELNLMEGQWVHSAQLQYNDGNQKTYTGAGLTGHGYGTRLKTSYVTSYAFAITNSARPMNSFTFAVDYENEAYRNVFAPFASTERRTLSNTGLVGEYFLDLNGETGIGAAVRFDNNDHFQNATTYRVQASHMLRPGTRVRAAAGTGIKNPTNIELFGYNANTFAGNPNLKPESSSGWEAGIEQGLFGGQALIGATYFDNVLKNEIYTVFAAPDFVASPGNRFTDSPQRGVELFVRARIGRSWRVDGSYTYLDAEEDGMQEIRRAPHIASLSLAWRSPSDAVGLNISIRHNGEQTDTDFGTFTTVTLPAFTLVNAGGEVRIGDRIQLFARAENLLDETYEEVFSFRAPGIGVFAGLRFGM